MPLLPCLPSFRKKALRYLGDTIESLRTYDPGTQRSIDPIDQAHVVPLQELLTTETISKSGSHEILSEDVPDRTATFIDYLTDTRPTLLVSEPDEVRAAIVKQREHIEASYAEAVRKNERAAAPVALVLAWEDLAATLLASTALEICFWPRRLKHRSNRSTVCSVITPRDSRISFSS